MIFSISFPYLIFFSYFMDTLKKRVWGESRPKDKVTLQIILIFTLTLTRPKTFTWGCANVFDKYLFRLCISVNTHTHTHTHNDMMIVSVKKLNV